MEPARPDPSVNNRAIHRLADLRRSISAMLEDGAVVSARLAELRRSIAGAIEDGTGVGEDVVAGVQDEMEVLCSEAKLVRGPHGGEMLRNELQVPRSEAKLVLVLHGGEMLRDELQVPCSEAKLVRVPHGDRGATRRTGVEYE